jgi:outer membrane protein
MIKHSFLIFSIGIVLFFYSSQKAIGQGNPNDSLELKPLISAVIQTYPTVQQANEALNAADLKIALARTAYLPNADISGSITHIGPVPSFEFPGFGTFALAPENNINAALNLNQTVYDFGKTRKSLKYEEANKTLSSLGIEQVKQKLSLVVIGCYYSLLYYQEAITIKDEQLATLREHLKYVEKKNATGSATQYEILSTQVRITNVESQKTDILSALNLQLSYLNMLMGQPANTVHNVREELDPDMLPFVEDSLVSIALNNRNEMKIVQKRLLISQAYLGVVKSQDNPVLSAYANGGWKNGYVPNLDKLKANYAVGLGLRIPIFDASRTRVNVKLAGSAIQTNTYEVDLAKRNITNDVIENLNALKASIKKSEQFEMQLSQAKKALELAEINFKAGSLTNLDLLDAENSVSESQLMLLKAKIDKAISVYKLKAALGIDLY